MADNGVNSEAEKPAWKVSDDTLAVLPAIVDDVAEAVAGTCRIGFAAAQDVTWIATGSAFCAATNGSTKARAAFDDESYGRKPLRALLYVSATRLVFKVNTPSGMTSLDSSINSADGSCTALGDTIASKDSLPTPEYAACALEAVCACAALRLRSDRTRYRDTYVLSGPKNAVIKESLGHSLGLTLDKAADLMRENRQTVGYWSARSAQDFQALVFDEIMNGAWSNDRWKEAVIDLISGHAPGPPDTTTQFQGDQLSLAEICWTCTWRDEWRTQPMLQQLLVLFHWAAIEEQCVQQRMGLNAATVEPAFEKARDEWTKWFRAEWGERAAAARILGATMPALTRDERSRPARILDRARSTWRMQRVQE